MSWVTVTFRIRALISKVERQKISRLRIKEAEESFKFQNPLIGLKIVQEFKLPKAWFTGIRKAFSLQQSTGLLGSHLALRRKSNHFPTRIDLKWSTKYWYRFNLKEIVLTRPIFLKFHKPHRIFLAVRYCNLNFFSFLSNFSELELDFDTINFLGVGATDYFRHRRIPIWFFATIVTLRKFLWP